ncbi:hypothetical protein [Roseateles sp.]|uniref:hypothetical protein n=1 Tax=Roseateles sp. TaxID=1971397 RepID=UPI0025D12211|nr:hypothetical protein [Roseateles sp.]MBV8034648.1 hypothetical protein [Roseateles sp.]
MPLPPFLSSLLNRTRAGLLVMLVLVLPLQGVVQLVAGVQGHRHVHTGTSAAAPWQAAALSLLGQPLRAALERLHAAHDPRLSGPKFTWLASRGPAAAMHQHGGILHAHSAQTHDALDVGDAADDGRQGSATAFLAWLPAVPALMARPGSDPPAAFAFDWRDRVVAPPLAPPRG